MKKIRIEKTSQYGSNGPMEIFEGQRKSVLNQLREEARGKRRLSRQAHKLDDNVHSLPREEHQSELVTMASFNLEKCGLEKLMQLLNDHGITRYVIAENVTS